MFSEEEDKEKKAKTVVDYLSSHAETKTHSRHINIKECKKMGLHIVELEGIQKSMKIEDCVDFQDCILTLHHTYMHTFANSQALKIIENHNGVAMIINGKGV